MNPNEFPYGIAIFILCLIIGSMALNLTSTHKDTLPFQRQLFTTALAIRVILSFGLYGFGLVEVVGDEDSMGWVAGQYWWGQWNLQGLSLFDLPLVLAGVFFEQNKGYPYMAGTLFFILGSPSRIALAVVNGFLGAMLAVLTYRTARILFSEWVARKAGWAICLLPSMIIWSAQTMKEGVVIFLEAVALYGCVRLKRYGFSVRDILLCGAAMILVIPFRFYAAYIMAAAVALSLLIPTGTRKFSFGSAAVLGAIVVPIVMMSGILAQHEKTFETFDLQYVQKFRTDLTIGNLGTGSSVKSDYDMNTNEGFSLAVLDGFAHLLLAPFPWELGQGSSTRMILTVPELVCWWWFFFMCVLPGTWYLLKNRLGDIQSMLFVIFGLGILYSMMFGNIGLIFRQRAQLMPWLIIFGMVGLERMLMKRYQAQAAKRAHEAQQLQQLVNPAAYKAAAGSTLAKR